MYSNLRIEDMTDSGQGIAHAEGLALFVPGALVGDVVTAEEAERKKNFALCRLVSIDEPSPHRIESDCEWSEHCGGCTYRALSYETELELKEKQLRDKLRRIAGIPEPAVPPIIPYTGGPHYRTKATYHISTPLPERSEGSLLGFYAQSSHSIAEPEDCLLQSEAANALANYLRRELKSGRLEKLALSGVTIKTAGKTGEVMAVLEGRGDAESFEGLEELIYGLDDAVYEAGKSQTVSPNGVKSEGSDAAAENTCEDNDEPGRYSLESVYFRKLPERPEKGPKGRGGKAGKSPQKEKLIHLAGKRTIEDEVLGLRLEISPDAFYQTNHTQTEALYSKVLEFADLKGGETVYDLYCGVGSIGLLLAREAGYVYGIESVKGAVLDANRNATINGIVNIEFLCGKAEDRIGELLELKKPDICVFDPPRAGCDEGLLEAVARAGADKLIYVSCDAGTLARDIKRLEKTGYTLEKAHPADMFPRTGELECVCLLSKRKVNMNAMSDL